MATLCLANELVVKYVALIAFKKIVLSHPDLVSMHQDVIMSCIDDQDVSIRLQALDLSAGMVNKENLIELVNRLVQQLCLAPLTRSGDDDGRSAVAKIEPVADSDGEDPEQVLRLSGDKSDNGSATPPEFRIVTMKHILDMCTKDTYANISDFEWYINTLVQLVGLVPSNATLDSIKRQGTWKQRGSVSEATGDEIAANIGRELRNVAVRVKSVRAEAVHAAASLLLMAEEHYPASSPSPSDGGALPFAAWMVGEYADQLSDLDGTLTALTNSKAGILPPPVLCAYLQAVPKLLACTISQRFGKWTAESQTIMSLLLAKLMYFLETLTMSPSLEVQERAVEMAELIRLASQAVADHARDSDHWPLLLTTAIPQLFGGSDLNPVAPSAQVRVPWPDDLDLELPLNPDLANLLQQVDEKISPELEAIDFEIFYRRRPDRKSREAEPAAARIPIAEPDSSSYQNTGDSDTDPRFIKHKRLERQLKNRDDPYYIASDQHSSGTSTPFHDIIRNTNGEGVDVDSIPIMNLDLGDRTSTNSYSKPEPIRPEIRKSKTYQIATDETIETDDSSEPLRTSPPQVGVSSSRRPRARDVTKRSLLEVDSSGLGVVALEGTSSAVTQLEIEKQESDNAEMAKALREVERLRLEMQRASERVQVSEGVSPEGTLVKKKKKKSKPSAEAGSDNGLAEHAGDVGSQIVRAAAPVIKRKRKKPPKLNEDLS